jgi:hypothetical protein
MLTDDFSSASHTFSLLHKFCGYMTVVGPLMHFITKIAGLIHPLYMTVPVILMQLTIE